MQAGQQRFGGGWFVAIVGVLALLLTGCGLIPPGNPDDNTGQVAGQLDAAVRTADRSGFEALFDQTAQADRVTMLWRNLELVEVVGITPAADGAWRVDWRVRGEAGLASEFVQPQWRCQTRTCLLTDLTQRPGWPAPIWVAEAIRIQQAGPITLVGAGDAAGWQSATVAAAQALAASDAPLLGSITGQVIEIPGSTAAFEQLVAAPAVDFRDTGAITWRAATALEPDEPGHPAVRIVLNPDTTADLADDARRLLLLHELAHAATDELGAPASGQRWVSEGLAEFVMLQDSPEQSQNSRQLLTASCPVTGTPPSDGEFADLAIQPFVYAWSAWAVEQVIASRPDPAVELETLWHTPGARPNLDPSALCTSGGG